jgi:group I intron endonuclease
MAKQKLIGIYCIWLFDGRCYIGQSVDIEKRWRVHRRQLPKHQNHSTYFYHVWDKYGPDAFTFDVIEHIDITEMSDDAAKTYLTEREQYWMDITFSCLNGCPVAGGSVLGRKDTEETKELKRQAMIGRDHWWGDKISATKMGHEVSEETRKILSDQRMGVPTRPCSPETRAKISAAHIGLKHSEESRAKMRASRLAYIEREKAEKLQSLEGMNADSHPECET